MFASKGFRFSALLATLIMAFSLVAVDTAEARRGGSFGSRGIRTERSVPSTQVSPNTTAPVQNTMTNGTQQRNTVGNSTTPARPSLFGGFGGALLGGFLFSGLFGLLFGFGFGGFGGMLALLVQVAIIGLIVAFFVRRRQQRPAMAGGPLNYEAQDNIRNYGGGGGTSAPGGPRSAASQRAGRRDEVGITDQDLSTFESHLREMQDAYSREDYAALRRITTPEVMGYLAEELGENATKGLRNEVFDVALLAGDVAEAWREGGTDYASVAMRYESRDVTRNRATGEIVSGDDRVTETTEVWTFQRQNGGRWLISAIQDA
ncbi:MAG TPA: TIM44-like domain-containing protein [Devosia sp.]|jgi:predicted lipid-binding transport protein (Tim44 family)|uniref:Tim44 domain-containing protein n=1 Tax=Devosia sp. TaxID=1871048 RepID=UPI002DDDA722|nr:TIM44-like domain-containing protein [Devosia sp.]HEV2516820.1 TIM44-like domain-containing protein [Devosia sp.]